MAGGQEVGCGAMENMVHSWVDWTVVLQREAEWAGSVHEEVVACTLVEQRRSV